MPFIRGLRRLRLFKFTQISEFFLCNGRHLAGIRVLSLMCPKTLLSIFQSIFCPIDPLLTPLGPFSTPFVPLLAPFGQFALPKQWFCCTSRSYTCYNRHNPYKTQWNNYVVKRNVSSSRALLVFSWIQTFTLMFRILVRFDSDIWVKYQRMRPLTIADYQSQIFENHQKIIEYDS